MIAHHPLSNVDRIRAADRPIPTRVLLVDDHPAVRLGARQLIDDQPDMQVVAQAAGVDEALSKLGTAIDVAVIDYQLRGGRDGLTLARHLSALKPAPQILIYSAFADSALTVAAIIAGANGVLSKETLGEELCTAIRRLARGYDYLPAVTASIAQAMSSRLVQHDQYLFSMLLAGIPENVVAERLGITGQELQKRRERMLDSLKPVHPRTGLVGAYEPLDYGRRRRRWAA